MQDGKHNVSVDQSLAELFDQGNSRQSSPVCLPPMVNQETLLDELSSSVLDNRYIIVTDDSHRIVGVVLSEEIRQKFATPNKRERDRWAGMALSFLISVTFPAAAEISTHNVLAVRQNDSTRRLSDTAYIATEHDLFLSWERISSILAGAMSDPLTGLPNRMAFDRRLNEEWNRSERTGCSIGAILLDLDHFKQINDTLGHAAGDAVLQDVATRFEDSLRSYDLVVRYGGDEFLILLPGVNPTRVAQVAERIRASVERHRFRALPPHEKVTVSIGAALWSLDIHEQPDALVRAADEALYRAKEEGRNTVSLNVSLAEAVASGRVVSNDLDSRNERDGGSRAASGGVEQ